MSGRGRGRHGERRGSTIKEVSSGGPACVIVVITPPVEQLVRQSSQGSGHPSGQGPIHGNSQKGLSRKQKRQASQFRKQKSPKQSKTDQQESLEQQPQQSNLVPRMNIKPTCHMCNKKHAGPRPDAGFLRQPALEGLTRSARRDSPRRVGQKQFSGERSGGGGGDDRRRRRRLMRGGGGVFCLGLGLQALSVDYEV
ncbi:hypothetical protein F511_42366 [Dorcoceras hygrometricum]|uniref:Uncharacterized protein n=1 Tax=Dorcoceras hygrometricum TaxID=472368 RepID=A0A2Z7ANK8_9LAMI|nr:hypothetical protein F511_42366 [Dorcoceras hygrometricum]